MNAVTDTTTISYSKVIRDGIYDRVIALPFFAGWTSRKSKMLQIQPHSLPYLGVYIVGERLTADGDPDVGDIRFIHALKLGFSAIIANNDPVASEEQLDEAFWAIMNGLLRDDTLTNLLTTTLIDNTRIEAFPEANRRHVWGNAGLNNETPYGELQFEMMCRYRSKFEPLVPDDLLEIRVRAGIPIGSTEEEQAGIPQAEMRYFFTARPSKVTGLAITLTSANEVDLSWTAATGEVSGYIVQHSLADISVWRTYSISNDPALLIEQVRQLAPTTEYDFRVCATGAGGDGDWSDIVTAATTSTTPAAPVQVTGLAVGTITSSSVDLSWIATANASRYRVQFSLSGAATWQTFSGEYSAITSTVTGLDPSTAYDFRVAALGPGGDGPWSTIVTATTTA